MKTTLLWLGLGGTVFAEITLAPTTAVECQEGETLVWSAAAKATLKETNEKDPAAPRDARSILPKEGWFGLFGKDSGKLSDAATKEWRGLVGQQAPPFVISGQSTSKNDGMGASGIHRNFSFRYAFLSSGITPLSWRSTGEKLPFFGARSDVSEDYRTSVRVLAYRPSQGVQALEFLPETGDDSLILYIPNGDQRMDEAIQWVRTWRAQWSDPTKTYTEWAKTHSIEEIHMMIEHSEKFEWNDGALHAGDDLRIPRIQMNRLFHSNVPAEGSGSNATVTGVSFNADQSGGNAEPPISTFGPPHTCTSVHRFPRRFWFDRPFFLFLWREKADHPYMGVWFGNTSSFKIIEP
jgi:hypothetical protein